MKLPDLFDFTQGNLQDYVDCPYRFYLRYIRKIKWPALVVGDAVEFEQRGQTGARFHRLLQQYLLGVSEERLTEIANEDPNPQVNQWWIDFLTHVPPWLTDRRYVESTFATNLEDQHLTAKYDLVMVEDNGNIIIFDWKTSEKRPHKAWLLDRVQTRLYRFILSQAGEILKGGSPIKPEQVIMNYWFAPYPETSIALPYNQSTFQQDSTYFSNLIQEILNRGEDQFSRTEDTRHCRYCIYRSHCDRGIEAGNLADFDDFGVDPVDDDLEIEFETIAEIEF